MLSHAGYAREAIGKIAAELNDAIDFDRDRHILERYGITREHLMSRMGASPYRSGAGGRRGAVQRPEKRHRTRAKKSPSAGGRLD